MVKYYAVLENNYVFCISENKFGECISEDMYTKISNAIKNKPTAPQGYAQVLKADTLEWELVEIPPVPPESEDVSADEILDIIFGGESI